MKLISIAFISIGLMTGCGTGNETNNNDIRTPGDNIEKNSDSKSKKTKSKENKHSEQGSKDATTEVRGSTKGNAQSGIAKERVKVDSEVVTKDAAISREIAILEEQKSELKDEQYRLAEQKVREDQNSGLMGNGIFVADADAVQDVIDAALDLDPAGVVDAVMDLIADLQAQIEAIDLDIAELEGLLAK